MIRYQFEEDKTVRPIWGWIIVIVLSILTLVWGMITHMAVPDVQRHWDFGVVPDAPGESAFSTVAPPRERTAPLQIESPLENPQAARPPTGTSVPQRDEPRVGAPSREG